MRTQRFAGGVLLAAAALTWGPDTHAAGVSGSSHWQRASVELVVDSSIDLIDSHAFDVLVDAISAWQGQESNLPTLVAKRGAVGPVGYDRHGENQNSVRFAPKGAPIAKDALGVTIVTSEPSTGRIVDADIVLNGDFAFAILAKAGNSGMPYDLQNVLTHEMGHFLGLPEEHNDSEATMFATSRAGEVHKRDLNATDRRAVGELYVDPPSEEEVVGCGGATVAGARSPGLGAWSAIAGLALLFRQRRSRRSLAGATTPSGGGWKRRVLAFAGLLPAALAVTGEGGAESTAVATTSYVDGIIWTHYTSSRSRGGEQVVSLPGGRHGDLQQEVRLLRLAPTGDTRCDSH